MWPRLRRVLGVAEPFSVLMSVYAGDRPAAFAAAIASVTTEQTLAPSELVLVVDGPVPAGIAAVLRRVEAGELTGTVPVRLVALPGNVGLALALEEGLDACRHSIVARADADDLSLAHRFAVQVPMVAGGLDLVGSALVEFAEETGPDGVVRELPVAAADIATMARFRDPFNHPTVVYRREAVRSAGGYEHLNKMEDYWLFARMIMAGAAVANTDQILVRYRVGAGAYDRRGGFEMLRSELILQWHFRRSGFTSIGQFARNVLVRGGYRLVPVWLRSGAYRRMVRPR